MHPIGHKYSSHATKVLLVCSLLAVAVAVGSIAHLALDMMATEHIIEFIIAFSLFKNIRAITTTKQPRSAIESLNGIRVISMFWIILFHIHVWSTYYKPLSNNAVLTRDILSRFWYQIILNGNFAVDTFIVLSATVAAYNSLRSMEKKQSNWCHFLLFRFYVHRYLRLTMVYAFVVFFQHLIVHLSDGPLSINLSTSPDNQTYKNCDAYWWTNLIYISSFYPWRMRDVCMLWTWSLANDMQFYVISPLIWIPLYYSLRKGLAIAGVLLSTSFMVTAAITGKNGFSPVSVATSTF